MIERLVFISTLFFFVMIGVNAFLIMGNSFQTSDGTALNIFGDNFANNGLSYAQISSDSNSVVISGDTSITGSTTAPGSAESVPLIKQIINGVAGLPGALGLSWINQAVFGAEIVMGKLAAIFPVAAPLIFIFVTIAYALKFFFFAYWGMAGARAFLGRFL